MEITHAALQALQSIYLQGIMYKKSGVVVSEIEPMNPFQPDLFDPVTNRTGRARLMKAIDQMNHRYGLKTVQLAVEGEKKQPWKVKCEHRSGNYLTNINELLTIHI